MYATGISRSPEKLIGRLGLESHRHFILFIFPVRKSDDVVYVVGEMHRYHLWVFDSAPLVLPRLEEHVSNGGGVDIGRVRSFSKGIDTEVLGDPVEILRSCIQASTSLCNRVVLAGTHSYQGYELDDAKQSASTFHQDVPRQTYTTAGTIYNPNNAQPLQPPVRRARSVKWPPPAGPASELSLFPKSALSSLSLMKPQPLCTTPISPLPNQIPKYSPLQQNYDRAISPSTDHSRESPIDLDIRSLSTSRVSSFNMATTTTTQLASPMEVALPTPISDKQVNDHDSSDEEDDDALGENPFKGMTVKSLQNLASYPNPNQKRAQKALLRARPGVTPAPSIGTNASRSTTPAFSGYSYGDMSDMGNDGSHSPGPFHNAKLDPTDVLRVHVDFNKQTSDSAGGWRSAPVGNDIAGPFRQYNALPQRGTQVGAYKSSLATGPGAPLPLTAGPPGQRQYRTPTFESAMKALQDGPKSEFSGGETASDFYAGPPGLHKAHDIIQNPGPATPDHLIHSLPALLLDSTPDKDDWLDSFGRQTSAVDLEKMLDALTNDDKATNENKGFQQPADFMPFGHGKRSFNVGGNRRTGNAPYEKYWPPRPVWKAGTSQISDEALEARNERVNRLFYAGTGELGKSMESVMRDAEFRQFKRQVGVIGDGRPKPKAEKVEYPHISAQQVNSMTTKEAADPFITMAFSALLNQVEAGISQDKFHQWKDPSPSLVDRSEKGRQSVFGN
ncbi:hypothetical protein COL922a_002883 [Colletotrichum nupharicola]|nr:hypothetical protein COL922a_002883 [Colletotrichum nupharicola]